MNNRNDFDNYENLSEYWLKEDALRSLDYDLYFSLATRYYCDAGCKVCYIKDNLKQTKNLHIFPEDLEKYKEEWFKVFEYFEAIRTNDDMFYLKHHHPDHYEWYKQHGNIFELCITDNAIFRTLELDDLNLKSIGDVSISTDFINQIGVEKTLTSVKELYDRFGIKKIKYIDCGHPELFHEIIEWANKLNLHNCVHHDFRTNQRTILNHAWAEYQNTWVTNHDGKLNQIYRESIHLYYDRFYYSSDDASDLNIEEFHIFENNFNANNFMVDLIRGKQKRYFKNRNNVIEKKFRDYYNKTQQYKVNDDFNYIPIFMFPQTSKFFYKMKDHGWNLTKYGLILGNPEKVIPIIENI